MIRRQDRSMPLHGTSDRALAVSGLLEVPALLGFGFLLVWGTCAPLVQSLLFGRTGGQGATFSTVVHALFLLAFAVAFNYRRRNLYSVRLVVVLGGCVLASLAARLMGPALPEALLGAGAVLEALARAGFFLLWVEQYARFAQRTAWPAYALSFLLVPLSYFVVLAMPAAVGFAAVYGLLGASCVLLCRCARVEPGVADPDPAPCTWRVPWRPAALMAVFSLAYYTLMHFSGGSSAMGQLGNLLAAAGMLVLCLTAFDRINLHGLYKVFLSLGVCALLLCVQGVWPLGDVASLLSYAGFNGFTLLVLFVLNGICFRYGVRAVWLFGVVRASEVAAHAAGSALGGWLARLDGTEPLLADAVLDAVVIVLVVLGVFLLSERDFSSTWGVAPVGARDRGREPAGASPAEDAATPQVATAGALAAETAAHGEVRPEPPLLGSYYEDFVWRCSRVARHYGLTHREEEVLALLAQDKTSAEIEAALFISHNTAKGHLRHLYDKLGVHSREGAAAVVHGWR